MNSTLFRSRLDFKLPPIVGYVFLIPPKHHQFRTKTREQRRKLRKQSIKRIFPPRTNCIWRHGAPWHFGNYARRFRPWNLFVVYRRSPGILNRRSRRFSPSWRPRRSTMISSTITCAIKIPISRVSPLSHGRKSFTSAVIPLAFPTIFFLPPFYVFYRSCSISRNTFDTFYKGVLRVAHIRESLFRVQKIEDFHGFDRLGLLLVERLSGDGYLGEFIWHW